MEDQTRHIYKKVELENIVNADTIKQDIEVDKLDNDNNNLEKEESEINPYHDIIATHLYHKWNSGQYLAV